ncbi:putative kinase-like protein TMKL1 [Platanthera zijinensis]|uniref:Kinase-like protein TMKL1 n=1 Tax=Platanthera zijinensis TaxID=2320716 RepID=A0AAP0G9V9_9ASPA
MAPLPESLLAPWSERWFWPTQQLGGCRGGNGGVGERWRPEEEEEMDVEEEEENDNGVGKLVVFDGVEHLTLEYVLNATGQMVNKTNYETVSPLPCSIPFVRFNLSLLLNHTLQPAFIRLPIAALAGSLPCELTAFSSLSSLNLVINFLTGLAPFELPNCPSLYDLDIAGNLLTVSLPHPYGTTANHLISLRLHGNTFSGALPDYVTSNSTYSNLPILDLGGNLLAGEFPTFFGGGGVLESLGMKFVVSALGGNSRGFYGKCWPDTGGLSASAHYWNYDWLHGRRGGSGLHNNWVGAEEEMVAWESGGGGDGCGRR